MAIDLSSVLRLNPALLQELALFSGNSGGDPSAPASLLPLPGAANLPLAPGAAPPQPVPLPLPAGSPAPQPVPLAQAAPQPSPGLGQPQALGALPSGDTSVSALDPVRPNVPLWRNFLGNMAAAGGGDRNRIADFKDPTYSQRVAAQRLAQAKVMFPNDPVGQTLYVQGDPDLMKSMAENYKDMDVKEGDTVSRNGKPILRAPKTYGGVDGGSMWTMDDQGHAQWLGQRPPSAAEKAEMIKAEADAQRAAADTKVATARGVEADAKATDVEDKRFNQRLLDEYVNLPPGQSLPPNKQRVVEAVIEGMRKNALPWGPIGSGQPPAGGGAPAPSAAPAGALSPNAYDVPTGVQNHDGVTYQAVGRDGKRRLYQVQGGKSYAMKVLQ